MGNAATALGFLGGLLAPLMGLVSFGYTEALYRWGEWPDLTELPDNVDQVRAMSVITPLLAIAGQAWPRPVRCGGLILGAAAAGLYWALGTGAFSIFPVTMCALASILGLAARSPDRPRAH